MRKDLNKKVSEEVNNIKDMIQYEDKYLMVCVKPAGFPVQSARLGQMDMECLIRNYLAEQNPGKVPFVGVIQRLDQPVEGILVFAKDKKTSRELNKQLASGELAKSYLAVIHGNPVEREGQLEDYLQKDGRTNSSKVVSEYEKGKRSQLSYKVLEMQNNMALVEVVIATGRHHQIRVQMAAHNMPLAGDHKYGIADEVNQVALCADFLAFRHPITGQKLEYRICPQGEIFQKFERIRQI